MAYQQMRDAGAQYRKGGDPFARPAFDSYETQYDPGYDTLGYQQGGLRPLRANKYVVVPSSRLSRESVLTRGRHEPRSTSFTSATTETIHRDEATAAP